MRTRSHTGRCWSVLAAALLLPSVASTSEPFQPAGEGVQVLFIGNSITRHGPSTKQGWPNDWGMAASTSESDYVSLTMAAIRRTEPGAQAQRASLVGLERGTSSAKAVLDSLPVAVPAVVVVQGGDNVPKSPLGMERFARSINELIAGLRQRYGQSFVLRCVGPWFAGRSSMAEALSTACEEHSGRFIRIDDLQLNAANGAAQSFPRSSQGVQQHPGDAGMALIALRIDESLQ